jgi:hypothetical protein
MVRAVRIDGTGNRALPFANQAELAKLADWSDESLAHACAKIRYPHLRQPDPLEVPAGSAQKEAPLSAPPESTREYHSEYASANGLMCYCPEHAGEYPRRAPAPGAGPIALCGA